MGRSYDAAVEAGAALIDAALGRRAWDRELDFDKLDMAEPQGECGCVLAQTFGSFAHGLFKVGLEGAPGRAVADHGFDTWTGVQRRSYERLKAAWARLVERRIAGRRRS